MTGGAGLLIQTRASHEFTAKVRLWLAVFCGVFLCKLGRIPDVGRMQDNRLSDVLAQRKVYEAGRTAYYESCGMSGISLPCRTSQK